MLQFVHTLADKIPKTVVRAVVWNWQVTNSTETMYFTWVVWPSFCTLSELTLVSY